MYRRCFITVIRLFQKQKTSQSMGRMVDFHSEGSDSPNELGLLPVMLVKFLQAVTLER